MRLRVTLLCPRELFPKQCHLQWRPTSSQQSRPLGLACKALHIRPQISTLVLLPRSHWLKLSMAAWLAYLSFLLGSENSFLQLPIGWWRRQSMPGCTQGVLGGARDRAHWSVHSGPADCDHPEVLVWRSLFISFQSLNFSLEPCCFIFSD